MRAAASTVLIVPGWQGSGPEHWQSHWERRYGDHRVEQRDWLTPKRADWIDALENAVGTAPGSVVLVAHSLGCALVAHWAASTQQHTRVRGALLVAPSDIERPDMPDNVADFRPLPRQRLPFPAIVVISADDPRSTVPRSLALAQAWGARSVEVGPHGHLNAASGMGDWPEGRRLLVDWLVETA